MFCENYDSFVAELQKRNFAVHSAASGDEAKALICGLIGSSSVGCGGSVTVQSLGLPDALRAQGAAVYFHWNADPATRAETLANAAHADWYLCSTNAITRTAKLINIDGTGNRVAGMFAGPKKVIIVIGKNKFAEDVDSAIDRVKKIACVKNAQRLNFNTPCAKTGVCTDCYSPQRICNVATMIEAKPGLLQELHLVLVDEELGY